MALYVDEEEVWKCIKHPSKRRKTGICPNCLRDRLAVLCPDCADVRPCSCSAAASSTSSSSSSSFSRLPAAADGGVGSVGKVHNLIERDPGLRRSRSLAIPFLRSRSRFSGSDRVLDPVTDRDSPVVNGSRSARSFWSMFKPPKSNRGGVAEQDWDVKKVLAEKLDDGDASRKAVMARSRSVAVTGVGELRPRTKGKGWFFPSPMKAFRQSKASKVVQERSPLYRG